MGRAAYFALDVENSWKVPEIINGQAEKSDKYLDGEATESEDDS